MLSRIHPVLLAFALAWAGIACLAPAQDLSASGPRSRISVSFSSNWHRKPQTGSIYLFISPNLVGEPRLAMGNWEGAPWIFRKDVTRLEPGTPVHFDHRSLGFPDRLGALPPGEYAIQAIFDLNPDATDFVHAHGNGRSRLKRAFFDPAGGQEISIDIRRGLTRLPAIDLPRVNYRKIESRIIGRHHGRRIFCNVALLLPPGYGQASREGKTFPVQYWIPDHGTTSRGALKYFQARDLYHAVEVDPEVAPFIRVILDPHCGDGHHYWANSATNGAYLTALFREILPAIEEEFAIKAEASSRFLVGHGAGGWAATNILLRHPDEFAAAAILAPDPLDFEFAFGLNLAADPPQNALRTPEGAPRPFVIRDGRVAVTMAQQARYESTVLRGGVLRSFENAFTGRRGEPLFDRAHGRIDASAADAVMRHDLKRFALENAKTLFPKIDKKLRIAIGDRDDFQLVAPTLSFATALRDRGLHLRIDTIVGADHKALDSKSVHRLVQRDLTRIWNRR
jgi:pimeloyl-ACP methyl ester carboxylesterase